MPNQFATVLASVSLAACSVVGVRSVEEPPSTVLDHVGAVEIRQYGERVAAQTVVDADVLAARSAGFRRIAGYIFGGNRAQASIAMTAPVAQAAGEGGQVIQFFMPSSYALGSLPAPRDPAVQLVTAPAQAMAVLRFSGSIAPDAVGAKQQALLDALRGSAWRADGAVVAWFYDPPWTLPPFRRNEVAVPVTR